MQKKNQHYVPQFHLRKWSDNGKLISLYNKGNGIFVDGKASIKNVASKDYIYGKSDKLENFLSKIESHISPVYEKIIADKTLSKLTDEEITLLYLHLTLCNERTLATSERYELFYKTSLYEIIKTYQAHGQYTDIDLTTFNSEIKVKVPANISIGIALKMFPIITDLRLILLYNTSDIDFITSDYPTIKYNLWSIKRQLLSGWGLSSAGLMLILPISPKFAIMAYDSAIYKTVGENNGVIAFRKNGQVNEVNKLMILNANSTLFFSKKVNLHYIKKLINQVSEYLDKDSAVNVFGTTNDKLIGLSSKKIFYEATFNFLTLYEETLTFPVPTHMQGLLRPASERIAKEIKN